MLNFLENMFVSLMSGLGVGIVVSIWIPFIERKQKEKAKISAALSFLEATRLTLITFKKQHIQPRTQNAAILIYCIINFSSIERFIEDKKIEDIYKKDPHKAWTLLKEYIAPALSNHSDTHNQKDYEQAFNTIYSFSDKSINDFQTYIFDNQVLFPNPLNISYPEKTFYSKSWSENLHFITAYNPGFLITFDKVFENLNQLNFIIREWNKIIEQYRASESIKEKREYIGYYLNFSLSLSSIGTDATLEFIQLAFEHLQEYAKENYKNDYALNHFEIKCQTDVEHLMPKLSDRTKEYKSQIDQMKIKSFKFFF